MHDGKKTYDCTTKGMSKFMRFYFVLAHIWFAWGVTGAYLILTGKPFPGTEGVYRWVGVKWRGMDGEE
jgi:hypothetical protein